MSKGKSEKEYFLNIDHVETALGDLVESQERALELVSSSYSSEDKYEAPRETIVVLMELIVAIEDFLNFVENLTATAEILEKGEDLGIRISSRQLDDLALRSLFCRDLLDSLRPIGLVLDTLQ